MQLHDTCWTALECAAGCSMCPYPHHSHVCLPVCHDPQAQATLVRSFKRLRGDDAAPGSHSAYRITVRQLEALVRLSEAMARVYLSPAVTGEHVAEVRRALGGFCALRRTQIQPSVNVVALTK